MSRKSREKAKSNRLAQDKARQNKPNAVQPPVVPNVAPVGRSKIKRIVALCAVLSLIVAIAALFPYYLQAKAAWDQVTLAHGQLKATEEQLTAAQEAIDRAAGRLVTRTEIIGVIPKMEEMKHLLKPMTPLLNDVTRAKPAEFIFFKDLHALFRVNPRIRLKNIGNEIVESVKIQVQELSVMAVGPKEPLFLWTRADPKEPFLVTHKPTLELIQGESYVLSEKLKPGDEAFVPIWRPLIKAMLKARVAKGKNWNGKYHGAFEVSSYVRGTGTTGFDKSEKACCLGFTWSAEGFTQEICKKNLDDRPIYVKVVSSK